MLCLPINSTDAIIKSTIQSNKNKLSQYRTSYLSSSHLQQLFKSLSYDSIIQPPSIPYPIKTSTTSCKLLKDEPTISPTNPTLDQPNNLKSSNFNITFGDELIPKQNNVTRLLYHNSVSLGIPNNSHNLEVICEAMYTYKIDIASLVKTNTHWKHDNSLPKLKQVLKQFWSRTNISTSETITPWKSIYKPGGSVTISTTNIASSAINTGKDEERLGRW